MRDSVYIRVEVIMPNIVQAEFFLVGGKDVETIEALIEQCSERVVDGLVLIHKGEALDANIKKVVRFFDEDGSITAFVKAHKVTKEGLNATLEATANAKGLYRVWQWFWADRWSEKNYSQRLKMLPFVTQKCRDVVVTRGSIAVQRADRSFRFIRGDEVRELFETIGKATGVWLFIFEPNDLLAEKNTGVASFL